MSSPAGDAAAFEAALRDNPDDLAGWCAYADWLTEQGDPRGEFMQVQLALEDESRTKDERDRLKEREKELLLAHEKEWLGELAPFLLGDKKHESSDSQYNWQRGFVAALAIRRLDWEFAEAIALSPETRFLSELHIHRADQGYDDRVGPSGRVPTPDGLHYHHELLDLIGCPGLVLQRRSFQPLPQTPSKLTGESLIEQPPDRIQQVSARRFP